MIICSPANFSFFLQPDKHRQACWHTLARLNARQQLNFHKFVKAFCLPTAVCLPTYLNSTSPTSYVDEAEFLCIWSEWYGFSILFARQKCTILESYSNSTIHGVIQFCDHNFCVSISNNHFCVTSDLVTWCHDIASSILQCSAAWFEICKSTPFPFHATSRSVSHEFGLQVTIPTQHFESLVTIL